MVEEQKSGVIMFMGPPGSGKGTQARFVQERLGFERIETGAILRAMRNENTPIAKLVTELIDAGNLAPPPLVAQLVIERAKEILARGVGVVFDGSPRTLFEVEELLKALGKDNEGRILTIALRVPINNARERLLIRLVCKQCNTPATNNRTKCEHCGGELMKRADDDSIAMENRWDEYNFRTLPVINYLDSLGLVEQINGARLVEEVAEDVEKAIRKRIFHE
jgi:adenylate kinase